MWKENRIKQLDYNLKNLKSLLKDKKRDSIDASDNYLKVRISETDIDILKLKQ